MGSLFTNNTYPGVSVEHIDVVSSIQVVNRTFTIDFKSVCGEVNYVLQDDRN